MRQQNTQLEFVSSGVASYLCAFFYSLVWRPIFQTFGRCVSCAFRYLLCGMGDRPTEKETEMLKSKLKSQCRIVKLLLVFFLWIGRMKGACVEARVCCCWYCHCIGSGYPESKNNKKRIENSLKMKYFHLDENFRPTNFLSLSPSPKLDRVIVNAIKSIELHAHSNDTGRISIKLSTFRSRLCREREKSNNLARFVWVIERVSLINGLKNSSLVTVQKPAPLYRYIQQLQKTTSKQNQYVRRSAAAMVIDLAEIRRKENSSCLFAFLTLNKLLSLLYVRACDSWIEM